MEKITLKIKSWIKENPAEFWILIGIIIIGSFFRLYKIDQYMTFLGDEGRDVIIARRIFTELHPPLIGPGTSIGNMYLGPLYYYMMAIPLLLAGYNPVGPAIQIAILGIATIWFVWYVGRKWFGSVAGLIAAGLFAISPTIIIYSRSSWNPNIMPFFSLLTMWSIWKVWRDKAFNWLIVLGIAFACVLQSHYLGLLLAPTIFIFWVSTLWKLRNSKKRRLEIRAFIQKSVIGFVFFILLMSPLFFFDIRHNWVNIRALYTFLTVRQTTLSIRPWIAVPKLPEILNTMDKSILAAKNAAAAILVSSLIILGILFIFIRNYFLKKNLKILPQFWFLILWLVFGLIGFGLLKQNIFDHYYGFLFVVPFLLLGLFLSIFIRGRLVLKSFGVAILIYLSVINLLGSPLRKEPNRLLQRSMDVSHKIIQEAKGQPVNLAVIADNNYEAGYQYFVELYGGKVLEINALDKSTFANQLFVICELIPTAKCDPTHNPKAQIASFGWSRIEAQWELDGVIIYKLIHSK